MSLPSSANMRLEIAALTDKGVKRSANEDAYGLFDLPGTDAAIVVADGMGGLQAGDIASEESVKAMEETLRERLTAGDSARDALQEAFVRANTRVYAIAEEVRRRAEEEAKQAESDMPTARRGDYSKSAAAPKSSTPLMGATVVAAIVQGNKVTIGHAGDSRLYRLRAGNLTPLTFDHSFVAERVRAGDITEAEARVSRFRNMITRAVGIDDSVQPEIQEQVIEPGDTLLLCSDGLNTMLEDGEIGTLLSEPGTAKAPATSEAIAASLVNAANNRGGSDNITVVVVRARDESGVMPAVAAPVTKTSAEMREPVTPLEDRRPTRRPEVVDMGGGRSSGGQRGGIPPFVGFLAFLGVLSLGIAALLAAPDMRQKVGKMLAPAPAPTPVPRNGGKSTPITGNTITIKDYNKLTYGKALPFGATVLAVRSDLLGYSPKAGIFFVTEGGGKMVYMSKEGNIVGHIADFEAAPPPPSSIPPSRVYYAVDLQGNSYISYPARKLIERRDVQGRVTAKITSAERPEAITVDEDGNLYVIYNGNIKKLEAMPDTGVTAAPAKPKPTATP